MKVEKLKIDKRIAERELKKYKSVVESKLRKEHKIIMKIYRQILKGKAVISLKHAFETAGLNELKQPKLAIARADWQTLVCEKRWSGNIIDFKERMWSRKGTVSIETDVFRDAIMDRLETQIPMIPPWLSPSDLSQYYILWEVVEWRKVQPRDPILLRPLTKDLFVVVSYWNLTPVERLVLDSMKR